MLVLCEKLCAMCASCTGSLSTQNLAKLVDWSCTTSARGPEHHPREVIRDFIELLDLLYQNPSLTLGELMESEAFTYAKSTGRLR